MDNLRRRRTDAFPFRLLISTIILCTFIILGVLAFVIYNMNLRMDESIEGAERGIICLLGSVHGTENIDRPPEDNVDSACDIFLERVEDEEAQLVP